MKIYVKPLLKSIKVVQNEAVATVPWGAFAPNLDELGGNITSYDYGSGAEIGGNA